ncbi:unnamed protein product [Rotaria socialis]|uniref:Uncharacterized protein n=3 Tax=Rotaria socialis TaxID=392032 RepID=A0A820VH10_9BILA|nr:unnamed protein product [Rotaria socialis]
MLYVLQFVYSNYSRFFPANDLSKTAQSTIVEFSNPLDSSNKYKQKINIDGKKTHGNRTSYKCSSVCFLSISLALVLLATATTFMFALLFQIPTTASTALTVTVTTSTSTTTTSAISLLLNLIIAHSNIFIIQLNISRFYLSSTTTTTTPSMIIYTKSFINSAASSSQCTAWVTFLNLLVPQSYTSLTMKGSTNSTGIALTNATLVTAIANALYTNTSYGPVSSNGYSWAVGLCGTSGSNSYELTATGTVCSCATGYTVRPCIGNQNWGGINGTTCGSANQTMTVIFQ